MGLVGERWGADGVAHGVTGVQTPPAGGDDGYRGSGVGDGGGGGALEEPALDACDERGEGGEHPEAGRRARHDGCET